MKIEKNCNLNWLFVILILILDYYLLRIIQISFRVINIDILFPENRSKFLTKTPKIHKGTLSNYKTLIKSTII